LSNFGKSTTNKNILYPLRKKSVREEQQESLARREADISNHSRQEKK
jgi:hypothetical protein